MVSLSCYLSVYLPFVFRVWMSARSSRYVLPLHNIFKLYLRYHGPSRCSAQHYTWTKEVHWPPKFTIKVTDRHVLWLTACGPLSSQPHCRQQLASLQEQATAQAFCDISTDCFSGTTPAQWGTNCWGLQNPSIAYVNPSSKHKGLIFPWVNSLTYGQLTQ